MHKREKGDKKTCYVIMLKVTNAHAKVIKRQHAPQFSVVRRLGFVRRRFPLFNFGPPYELAIWARGAK